MAYGLTAEGFVPKTLEILREEMNDAARTAFGASIDVSDGSPLGQWIGIMAERYAELWELGEAIVASQDPEAATGVPLAALCALTGTLELAATKSTVALTLTGTPSTVVAVGSRVSVASTADEFASTAAGTITILTAWAISTAYVVGDRRRNGSRCYICRTAGTSAGSGGPTTTAADITDNTVHWRYLGEGTGVVDVEAEAVETGPTVAVAFDITGIETPVSGWSSVINLLDADLGTDEETDEDLRVRRQAELATGGTSPVDALRADLLAVDGVTTVRVFVNNTDATDADGVPPHSVECLVQGGTDQDIWNALLASVAAGIGTHGDEVGTAEDDQGTAHTMRFNRPEEILIYVDVTLIKDPDEYPATGDALVKAAIVEYGDLEGVGRDVVESRIRAAIFGYRGPGNPTASAVLGVLDVNDIDIGTSAAPTVGTTVVITSRQLAVHDTSRITVSTSDGTP